jgi:hypothetical protein
MDIKAFFNQRHEYDQHQNREARLILERSIFPTSAKERELICSLSLNYFPNVIASHKFWREHKLREGLFALIQAAQGACMDLKKHEAALSTVSLGNSRSHEHIEFTIANPFQKDVMAYCAAAIGIIDNIRRITKSRPDLEQKVVELLKRCFDTELQDFIKDLRNNLSHGAVVIPAWTINYGPDGTNGIMRFESEELLLLGKWCTKSTKMIREKTHMHVGEIIFEHSKSITKFHNAIREIFARNISDAERDYFDIVDQRNRTHRAQMMSLLVQQIGRSKNPYDHLHKFFEPEHLRHILRLPKHSKEQVDLIIQLKSVEMDCNDSLRSALYKIFSVAHF